MPQDIGVWILTFNRPQAVNRLVGAFGRQGLKVNVFSNHPRLELLNEHKEYVEDVVINSLNSTYSNSWCARSWNSIMLRSWHKYKKLILIQDDTMISDNFVSWIKEQSQKYDFIWGPGGDQFHYLTFETFQKIGYWDERFIGCYCGDADYLKRAWHHVPHDRISVEEKHNWGFFHNVSGIIDNVLTEMPTKMVDANYQNQHWQLGGKHGPETGDIIKENPTVCRSQRHFYEKWGAILDNGQSVARVYDRRLREIDWYPWFTKIQNVNIEESPVDGDLYEWSKRIRYHA